MTNVDFDDDRLRNAFVALSDDARFGDACPSSDVLWAGARGELPPNAVEQAVAHLAECGACAAAWRLARDFGEAPVAAAPSTGSRGLRQWLPLAAALVMLAGSAWIFRAVQGPVPTAPPAPRVTVPAPPQPLIPLEKPAVEVSAAYALTWRGSGSSDRFLQELAGALAPYQAGDYTAAIPLLDAVAVRYPDLPEPHFYRGVSRLLNGDAYGAMDPLRRAAALSEGKMKHDAEVNLAAAWDRTGHRGEAHAQLLAACQAFGGGPDLSACRLAKLFERPEGR